MFWLLDFVIVTVIIVCVIRGFQRGLVLSLFGALTLIVALVGAFIISGMFSHHAEGLIEPPISNWVESRFERNITDEGLPPPRAGDPIFEALRTLGVNENLSERIESDVSTQLERAGNTFQMAVTAALVSLFARMITLIVAFLLLFFGLRLLAHLLDAIAQLPILNIINKLGGLGGGLLQGVLIVWLGVTVLFFVGLVDSTSAEQSFWLRIFW
ncbi:MAG: CvpA family protein [Defluviitaleaceae bacterium]|nr:CvpA family protein [Defluviitaleaceae bacterium]